MTLSLLLLNAAPAAEALNIESLISDLAFILLLAAVATVVFKWLKQPVVLGYIVAGFLASPHFKYLPSVTTESNIDFWAQLGIVILLFSLGIEFSFKKLVNAGGSAVVTALIIISGMCGTGWCLGMAMGFTPVNSLFLGGMLSMSSTTIILKALNDLNLRRRKFANQVLAVLIVEDLFAVLMMVILSSIAINNSVAGSELLFSVSKLAFFLIIWFLVGVYILPSLLNSVRRFLSDETLLIIAMALCLGMAVFSVICGFSLALGAFVMGSILAGTSFAERIERVTTSVKDLFGAVFFISVGMMVSPEVIAEYWQPILLLSAAVIIGMILFGTFGMLVTGQTLLVALEAGFSLTQIGEFSFIIATLGMSLGVLEPSIYPIVVAVSVITTFLTPYFIRMAQPAYRLLERVLPAKLHALLDRYAERAVEEDSARRAIWKDMLKQYLWRIAIYSVILVAISLVSLNFLLPWLLSFSPQWGRLICAAAAIAAMAPFLIALSTSRAGTKDDRKRLLAEHAGMSVPLIVMMLARFVLAWLFIAYVLIRIFSYTAGLLSAFAVYAALFIFMSGIVKKHLVHLEKKFFSNLNERELRRSGSANSLVNDLHLAYVEVGFGCPFVGERLMDSDVRRRYGVNVANIQRGADLIQVPRGDVRIFPGDVLGVVGTESDIQSFLPVAEAEAPQGSGEALSAENVALASITLSDKSPVAGTTVAASGLRSAYSMLLVGVQREGEYLPVSGNLELLPGDILWVVGDKKKLPVIQG